MMKLTMEQITEGRDEVIIRYRQMNEEVETIVSVVQTAGKRIDGYEDGRQFLLSLEQIYYFESVDGVTVTERLAMLPLKGFDVSIISHQTR